MSRDNKDGLRTLIMSVLWQTPTLHSDWTIPKFPEDCVRQWKSTAPSCPHPRLIPRTSEHGILHGEGLCRCHQIKDPQMGNLSWIILEGPEQSQGSFLSQRGRQESQKPRSRAHSDAVAGRGPYRPRVMDASGSWKGQGHIPFEPLEGTQLNQHLGVNPVTLFPTLIS